MVKKQAARNKPFVAVLVMQSRVTNREEDLIVDHQVRIIRAPNGQVAYARAMSLEKQRTPVSRIGRVRR